MKEEALKIFKNITNSELAHLGDSRRAIKKFEPVLYHYTNIYALQNILKNKALWITKCDYLNDRSEIKYAEDLILEMLESQENIEVKKQGQQMLIHAKQKLENAYVLSLTDNEDSLALWSNYSKSEGYNLGIDFEKLIHSIFKKDTYIYLENGEQLRYTNETGSSQHANFDILFDRVIYNPQEQRKMIYEVIKSADLFYTKYCMDEEKGEAEMYLGFIISALFSFLVFFKDESFKAEEEYRFIFIIQNKEFSKKVISHKILNGSFIPYIKVCIEKGEFCDGIPLKSIKVGPRNRSDIALKGMKSFLEVNGYTNIQVSESKIPLRY